MREKIVRLFKHIFPRIVLPFTHFKTIINDPGKFALWFLTSVVLALSTVWLPSIIGIIVGKDLFSKLLPNNPFIVFSIVFLSNSVLTSINYIGAGTTKFAVALRGITLVFTIMYLILLSAVVPIKLLSDISLEQDTQFILLAITILLGVYVYGFREADWERSVDDARKRQDKEVSAITDKASSIQSTDGGVVL